jgi:hypothetical protein
MKNYQFIILMSVTALIVTFGVYFVSVNNFIY